MSEAAGGQPGWGWPLVMRALLQPPPVMAEDWVSAANRTWQTWRCVTSADGSQEALQLLPWSVRSLFGEKATLMTPWHRDTQVSPWRGPCEEKLRLVPPWKPYEWTMWSRSTSLSAAAWETIRTAQPTSFQTCE